MNQLLSGVKQLVRSVAEFVTETEDLQNQSQSQNPIDVKLNEEKVPKSKSKIQKNKNAIKLIDFEKLLQESQQSVDKKFEIVDIFPTDSLIDQHCKQRKRVLRGDTDLSIRSNSLELMNESEIDIFLSRFNTSQLLTIAEIWPNLKNQIRDSISKQTVFWFCSDVSKARFFPFEDLCKSCDQKSDFDQFCTQVKGNQLSDNFDLLSNLMSKTPFESLKCLRLFRFTFDKKCDEWLAQMCPNLLHLDLTECIVSDFKGLAKHHKSLKHLMLGSTSVEEQTFRSIIKSKKELKTIVANCTAITGNSLLKLPKAIRSVDIRCCPQLDSTFLEPFFSSDFLNLEYLRIEVSFDDSLFTRMCCAFRDLKALEISDTKFTKRFTTEGLKQIANLTKLRSLKFGKNISFHSIPLSAISRGCPLMLEFTLDSTGLTAQVEQKDLIEMSRNWPLLRRLELKNINCIQMNAMQSLSQLKNLRHLDLTKCANIDDNCITENLPKFSKQLNYLILDKCHKLTNCTLNSMIERAISMDSVLTVSMFRCNVFVHYIKIKELPENLRLTLASTKSSRYMSWDGIRAKYGKCENIFDCFRD